MAQEMDVVTRVAHEEPPRRLLIEGLWPDKSLYAAVLLFLTGFVGLLTWAVDQAVGIRYADEVVSVFGWIPSWSVLVFSGLAVVFATLALRLRSTRWTMMGAASAFLSVGFFGANALLALVAVQFVRRARHEGEEDNPATRILRADMWPDKVLAASLIMVIAGVLTVVWGAAVAADLVTYSGYLGHRVVFGSFAILAGSLGLVAARRLYLQSAPVFSLLAALAIGFSVPLWVVGPVLAIAAGVLVVLGIMEHEFGAAAGPRAA